MLGSFLDFRMIYLTRPVFPVDPNWSRATGKRLDVDLRKVDLGPAEAFFAGVEEYAAQGYSFSVALQNAAAVREVDAFFEGLAGNLRGFWFPALFESFRVAEAVSGTQFKIANQGLSGSFADQPDQHVCFRGSASDPVRPAQVQSVADAGGGLELVTLTAPVVPAPSVGDLCCRLHYVRLAGDEESAEFYGEGVATRTMRLIELPQEYAAYELGEEPVWLYTVSCASPVLRSWRYTFFPARVVSDGSIFERFSMRHGELKRSAKLDEESLSVTAKRDAAHPFNMFLPLPPSRPVRLVVERTTLADPDVRVTEFNGFVRTIEDDGDRLVAHCESWASVLKQNVCSHNIQRECNHHVFDPRTCKLERWIHEVTGAVSSVDNDAALTEVVVELAYPGNPKAADWLSADWFAGGLLDLGFGPSFETRGIVSSEDDGTGKLLLRLNASVLSAVGAAAVVLVGCDGARETCVDKFDNYENFGGYPFVPEHNLSLQAIDGITSQGGKK
jgi:hypothetical protein